MTDENSSQEYSKPYNEDERTRQFILDNDILNNMCVCAEINSCLHIKYDYCTFDGTIERVMDAFSGLTKRVV